MAEKKNQLNSQSIQEKLQANPVFKQQTTITEDSKVTNQALKVKEQQSVQTKKNADLKDRKLSSKRLSLVLYEIMKNKQSLFSEEQKYPLVVSMGGTFLTLSSATLINFSQIFFKPDQKKKKFFISFGITNLLASIFLAGYSIYKVSDLYVKIPEAQWDLIQIEKQAYDKLSFKEKRAYFEKEMEEDGKKLKQAVIQNQLLKKQEKFDLTK